VRSDSNLARAQVGYAGKEETLPATVKAQPIPFSHRVHMGAASLKCRDCHSGAQTAEKAGMPTGKTCMACHNSIGAGTPAIAKLRSLSAPGQDIPWVKVYDLPDFVVFSHQTHGAARVLCADCHGPVAQRDVLAKEMSTSMTACMNCHVQRHARVDCSACHALGQ
jgi:c(7)-type cytochrome triheme protein